MKRLYTLLAAVASSGVVIVAQQGGPDHPSVTVHGQVYTPRSILARNMGTNEDQTTQFPPHKIIGNIYEDAQLVPHRDAAGEHFARQHVRA